MAERIGYVKYNNADAKPREKKTKPNKKGEAAAKLDALGIDALCERLASGESQSEIAASLGIDEGSIRNWLAADSPRSARAREARRQSAMAEDEKALKVLEDLPNDPTTGQVAKAREIASHRRWRAKVRDPESYGDRATIDVNATIESADTAALLSELAQALSITPEQARKMVGFAEGEKEAS